MCPSSLNLGYSAALQSKLKALGNRYAVEILQVLNPPTGEIISNLGWEQIVESILALRGRTRPIAGAKGDKTQEQVEYEELKRKLASGGTLYESMNKLVSEGFVLAVGEKRKKQRKFMISHEGRLALFVISGLNEPSETDTEVRRAAKILLKHKNFVRLLPAQEKFVREIGEIEDNLLIQMPPGSGKTFLAMIATLIRLQRGVRCLYLTPYISLNRQIMDEYAELFENLDYSVVRHDGQQQASEKELENADLIVGVYETFAHALLRDSPWTKNIGLAIIDEITELDSMIEKPQAQDLGVDRSTRLDCLITLLKKKSQIVTLSSRFGDTDAVAKWLGAKIFRPSARIMPDEFIAVRCDEGVEIFSIDGCQNTLIDSENIMEAVFSHIESFSKKSVLVVAGSRFGAEHIARFIGEEYPRPMDTGVLDQIVDPQMEGPAAQRLRSTLEKGVAFHHAGLDAEIRARLERMIKSGAVKVVVSTTGITSGTSFPFDSVIILVGSGLGYRITRSKYLQIAGRIGEYYLVEHGGSVYVIFDEPTRHYPDLEALESTLLYEPLEPLQPGRLSPQIMASLITRKVVSGRSFKRENVEDDFLKLVGSTLRGVSDPDYIDEMKTIFGTLFDYLLTEKVFETKDGKFVLSKESRAAISAGVNILEFLRTKKMLTDLDEKVEQGTLIDLILGFTLPSSIRPRNIVPTDFEIELMQIKPLNDWYLQFSRNRYNVKCVVIQAWVDETDVLGAIRKAREVTKADITIDEGDLRNLVNVCSTVAESLARFLATKRKKAIAERLERFSVQLRYGVREDLANSDLFHLQIPQGDDVSHRSLTRVEVRLLHDRGYGTIEKVVRKDIDPDKPGFARERFAKNSGFDTGFAKTLYKAALECYRRSRTVNE